MKKQHGFAHAVLIIGMAVALLGALGFIFWQNFIYQEPATQAEVIKPNTTKNEAEDADTNTNKTFSSNELSFEYPSNWVEKKDQYNDYPARIETDDFERNVGMGLKTGAELIIDRTTEDIAPPQGMGVINAEEIQLPVGTGYKYEIRYEGYWLQAKFVSKGPKYIVTMQTADVPTTDEKAAFDLIIETFAVK